MSARGLLRNPTLFDPQYSYTPLEAIHRFIQTSIGQGTNLFIFQHHLQYMSEEILSKQEMRVLKGCSSISGLIEFWRDYEAI